MSALYDRIGLDYAALRRPDPRIAAAIDAGLGDAATVLNVGAGAGSYEPRGRDLTALEPSAAMIAQRPEGAAPCLQGSAEALPFPDASFDAAMGVLTVHHWPDQPRGMAEMRRVARRRIVLLTFDPAHPGSWLADYLPELRDLDTAQMPPLEAYGEWLGQVDIAPLPIPHDCRDGFLYAYWRRPEAYLDARVRGAISSFHALNCEAGLARLESDLADGTWRAKYGELLDRETLDCGYRIVVAQLG